MHFFGLFGSSYIIPTTPETLKDVLSTHAYDYEKASAFKKYTTDQPIPKNTFVGLCTRAINHAEHLWGPDAAAFRPERWLERSAEGPGLLISPLGGAPASVCMLSFFHGTRSCVGRDLALAQMKRQIAVVVRRFRLETVGRVEEVRPCRLFATTPAPDLLVRFTELEG
ncbi:cytochrome P450 [Aspergillus aculeatinus CBS 121060]|uniref:Cytochrome P450 n=1 Tax=Aspergillus aculeatinus CBS 121060 TaxID=1448322 RepID=A0ACD1HMP4_9EURO|nr:cytochrome P450 [Aspergillus aculeatinus CBS 121060]RAH74947.1 cytochrome P450 [Aspergillus aculeatinus CBS 121060]